jgi:hypothetical protein
MLHRRADIATKDEEQKGVLLAVAQLVSSEQSWATREWGKIFGSLKNCSCWCCT